MASAGSSNDGSGARATRATAGGRIGSGTLAYSHHAGDHSGHHGSGNIDKDSKGLVSGLNGNNVNVPIQVCNDNVPVNGLGVQVPVEDAAAGNGLTGALGVPGSGESESGDSVTAQPDNCGQDSGSGSGDSIG